MKDLKGKVALITGGATGLVVDDPICHSNDLSDCSIGKALALELAKEPMRIVLASTNQDRLHAAAEEVRNAGASDVLTVVCDVANRLSVKEMHSRVTEVFGPVDLLVCNAGVTTGGAFVDHREADWDWVYDVVLGGTVNCIQLFYPDMVKRKSGHIVLTGSQAGMVPDWVTLHGPYTSAKSAVHALGSALRPEAAEHDVGVSTIIVAGTLTDIIKSERSRPERYGNALVVDYLKKREARRIPPSEVAEKIVRGVKGNAGWVATHPELKERTKEYFDGILAAYDR